MGEISLGELKVRDMKAMFQSVDNIRGAIDYLAANPPSHSPPAGYGARLSVTEDRFGDWPVYDVRPKNGAPRNTIVYFHGGGWYYEIISLHWDFIEKLVNQTGARVVVPIYPLIPTGDAATVVSTGADLAAEIIAAAPHSTTIMGDSAGGNIAFAVLQTLRNWQAAMPDHSIFISPGLDVTFTNKAIAEVDDLDPMLALAGIAFVGNMYRNGLDADDYRASPLRGDLAGLGDIHIFSGTRDIFNPDTRKLVALVGDVPGTTLTYNEVEGSIHIFPLVDSLPEAGEAQRKIFAILNT